MTWSLKNARNDESAKVRWELVPFMVGRACDIGCGPYRVFPKFIGIDNGHHWGKVGDFVPVDTAEKLDMFASQSFDCVYSSHLLEHIEDYKAALKEWWRLVRPGGYLCLYLPHRDLYPRCTNRKEWEDWRDENEKRFNDRDVMIEAFVDLRRVKGITNVGELYEGTPYANPDHKHDFSPEDIIKAMEGLGGFDLVVNEERNEEDEYSMWQVYRRLHNRSVAYSWKNPKPTKTAAVARYGAIGDMIIASSVFPALKEQGFHLTVYCQPGAGYEAIKHDPHVDRFILQEKDAVPIQFLGEFLENIKKKYDKFIHLSESVEGSLLAVPKSMEWYWPNKARAVHMDRNYLEWTHILAGVDAPYRPKFYSTVEERSWALKQKERFGRRNILWSLAGSSGHKVWPHLDEVILRVMANYPDVHVVLVGDESCKLLEQGFCRWDEEKQDFVETMSRVHLRSGKWTIRQSMAFAEVSDLIIGTETGLLNAAGYMEVPKIITLSHSSQEMLTKHWLNTVALEQPEGLGCPKRWKANGGACRQLHGGSGTDPFLDCPEDKETGTALCQVSISADQMWAAIAKLLGNGQVIPIKKVA